MSAALELLRAALLRLFTFSGGVITGAIGILVLLGALVYVAVKVSDAMDVCDEDYLF